MVRFFRHQLRMKITSDLKRLISMYFCESWVSVASLVRVNGDRLDLC